MDEEPHVSVPLDEYVDLLNLRDFFLLLKEFKIEDWVNWEYVVSEFLEQEQLHELPF